MEEYVARSGDRFSTFGRFRAVDYFAEAEIFERRADLRDSNSGEASGLSFQSMKVCWRSMKNLRVSGFSAKE